MARKIDFEDNFFLIESITENSDFWAIKNCSNDLQYYRKAVGSIFDKYFN